LSFIDKCPPFDSFLCGVQGIRKKGTLFKSVIFVVKQFIHFY